MVIAMKNIAERLHYARKTYKNWSQATLATAAGLSQSTIGNIEAGIRDARGSLPVIAKALGISHDWLAFGEGEMLANASTPYGQNTAPASHKIPDTTSRYGVESQSPTPAPGELALHVPLLANSGSMGGGSEQLHDDVIVGTLTLSQGWVQQRVRPANPKALRFIHAYGDSMSPTFEDGDILLVDTEVKDPRSIDGVYVMSAHERIYIKRVRQRLDGIVEISSDNPTVKTVDVLNGDHTINILGRVVWCWNGRKL